MASSDGSERIGAADAGSGASGRQPRVASHEGEQRVTSTDPDVLADQIERTRAELAETLDAIVDKVSPKRVAGRTTQKVKDGAADAAATVKATASEAAASMKSSAAQLKDSVQEKTGGTPGSASQRSPAPTAGALADTADAAPSVAPAGADLPPVTKPTAGLHAEGSRPPVGYAASVRGLPMPVLAGAAVALAVVLLVVRYRRGR